MFDDRDDALERVIHRVRRPVLLDPALDRRILARLARVAPPGRSALAAAWAWLRRPRPVRISPLGAMTGAALVAVVVMTAARVAAPARPVAIAPLDAFQFVLVERDAASVALVGDFNDWDPQRTPMYRAARGVWAAVVPLTPGRYRYAFLVDGAQWVADPAAPAAADDAFGTPSSVVTVGGS